MIGPTKESDRNNYVGQSFRSQSSCAFLVCLFVCFLAIFSCFWLLNRRRNFRFGVLANWMGPTSSCHVRLSSLNCTCPTNKTRGFWIQWASFSLSFVKPTLARSIECECRRPISMELIFSSNNTYHFFIWRFKEFFYENFHNKFYKNSFKLWSQYYSFTCSSSIVWELFFEWSNTNRFWLSRVFIKWS